MDAISISKVTQTAAATKSIATEADNLKVVSPKKLYSNDPLYCLLKDRGIVINDYVVIAVVGAFTAVVFFGLGALLHVQYYGQWQYIVSAAVQAVIVFPLVMLMYLQMPQAMANLFNVIQSNGVIEDPLDDDPNAWPRSYEEFVQRYSEYASRRWWTLAAIFFVVMYFLYRVAVILLNSELQTPNLLTFQIINALNNALIVYCITLAVSWLIAGLLFSNKLFKRFRFHLTPLHPDGCAGLGQMENALWISAVLIATIGIAALVMNGAFLTGKFTPFSLGEAIVIGLIYLALIPTLLLGWTLIPHQVMVDGCNEVLQPLAATFKTTISTGTPRDNEVSADIKEDTDRLSELKRRYQLLQDTFPLWPTQHFVRHIATLGIPGIITFIGGLPAIYKAVAPFVMQFFVHK
ncbi:MAG: hypothetical protein NVS9B9_04350 [Ktedonobacteraceae bacterium]